MINGNHYEKSGAGPKQTLTNRKNLSRKKKFAFCLIVLLIPAIAISCFYVVFTAYRTNSFYWYVKLNQRGWKGKVYRADSELGFVPVADSEGAEVFPIGDEIPMRYDKNGFRVPLEIKESRSPNPPPIVLTLGCSFTYGAATAAENTYPFLVGLDLRGTVRNGGVASYGLSQMMVLAKRLVPIHKPDYLLVQYSPWLVDRAQSPFAPTYVGSVTTPYFFTSRNELVLHPPVFQIRILDLPIDRYRNRQGGFVERASFLWNVGLPLYIHDDFNLSVYKLRRVFGFLPEPATNREQLTRYVYEEIAKVARANGAKLFIVVLGNDHKPVPIPDGMFPAEAIIVNAHDALLGHLPVVTQDSYEKAYFHWRGSPSRIVDSHPNENAHRIIAEAIMKAIVKIQAKPNAQSTGDSVGPPK
jgi:hypothetical protein